MSKQTAVDYLDEAIDKYLAYSVEGSHKGEPFKLEKLYAAVQQAKAMHKQELLNIFNCGRNFQATGEGTFNEIYNEIYGS